MMNIAEYGTLFWSAFGISFVLMIILEFTSWDKFIIPALSKGVPFYKNQIVEYAQTEGYSKLIIAIILAIDEPITIGIVTPLIFEGLHMLLLGIYRIIEWIEDIRIKAFKDKYLDQSLGFILNSNIPVNKRSVLIAINRGNVRYSIASEMFKELEPMTLYDSDKGLYWGRDGFNKMKKCIENTLLNLTPQTLEWLVFNVPEYKSDSYQNYKIKAINELVRERIFVVEKDIGVSMNPTNTESTKLYRHKNGSHIKSTIIDDPDFE